jgi:hypothetical protein
MKKPLFTSITIKNFKKPWLYYITGVIVNIIIIFFCFFLIKNIKANEQTVSNKIFYYKIEFRKILKHANVKIPLSSYSVIEKNLNIYLTKYNRKWSKHFKKKVILTLQKGEIEFEINHRDILAIMSIESNFKLKATNSNNNGTKDYGLCQINGPNYKYLNKVSERVLNKHSIKYSLYKYNPSLNIMNCYAYLNWSKRVLKKRKVYSTKKLIQSYNVGVNGCISTNKNYKKIRAKYYKKFLKERKRIQI